MNKKILALTLFVMAFTLMAVSVQGQTVLNMNWLGSGTVDTSFTSDDDAWMAFHTEGNSINGSLYAEDVNDNPYTYGVDTFKTNVRADIQNGGFAAYQVNRTDSQYSGKEGQYTSSYVFSYDGSATMDFKTRTNYHDLVSSNYGFQNNQQFTASGSTIVIEHELGTGSGEFGNLQLIGSGSASVDYMTDGYTGYNEYRFGYGDGCYENADLTANGVGTLTIHGVADNNMWAHDGSWSVSGSGGVSHTETWNYNGLLNVDDYAFGGN
jgi:hypothetical protein